MAIEAYALCPCGSGKKVKFCCQVIAGDMEKILRLQESHQHRLALQNLDALERKHPNNAWLKTTRAEILLEERLPEEAADTLNALLKEQPDHKYATGLLALASFSADGFELAKPAIHRAFQRCLRDFPALVGDLAIGIAAHMLADAKYLAARMHMALALRVAPDEHKSNIFLRMMEFDGNRRIPYPLRSVHDLAECHGSDEQQEEVRKANVLSSIGCWRPAARLFEKLSEQNPESAAVWFNVGMCRAWDGDEAPAAEALHKAAGLQNDFETAVEWETLAQLLEYNTTEDRLQLLSCKYDVSSVSRMLTALDEDERVARVDLSDADPDADVPSGLFYLVDEPARLKEDPANYTIETVPNIRAQLTIFDGPASDEDEGDGPSAYLNGMEGADYDAAKVLFEEIAGDLATEVTDDDDDSTSTVPRELAPLVWRWHFPEKTPMRIQHRLEQEKWNDVSQNVWTKSPLAVLGGKSPKEAAGDESLRAPLRAAVSVLDAYCDRSRYCLDVDALFDTLKIEKPAAVQFEGEASLNSLTAQQLLRIPVHDLSDEQLEQVARRAALVHHGRFLYQVLAEIVSRPECLKLLDEQRVWLSYYNLCREQGRFDEAMRAVERGKEHAQSQPNSFELVMEWVFRELTFRLGDPSDPEINNLLIHIRDVYLPKLPELRANVTALVKSFGVTPPWEEEDQPAVATPVGSSTAEGVWTPEGESSSEAPKKLWLPGQS